MSLYEVVCKLIQEEICFNINFDGVPGIATIIVGNWSNTFTSEDFHKAAQWMHDTAFKTGGAA